MIAFVALAITYGFQLPEPPPMPKRPIAKQEAPLPGREVDLYGDGKYILFIPHSWKPSSKLKFTIHFHGASWFAFQEHFRRGLNEPLLAVYVGEGSTVYRNAFANLDAWPRLLSHVMGVLDLPGDAVVDRIDMTSFSAGYGAVRELLRQSEPQKLIRRIVLADSMYASYTSPTDKTPLADQIQPYVPFAKLAMAGDKGFVVTCSQVPTETYANSEACARALVAAVGGKLSPVAKGFLPATEDPQFPLLNRFDKGGFHVWSYGGADAQAHMTHPRHIADIWKAVWGETS